MTKMVIQPLPANRAYFRTNISKNINHSESAESNLKTVEVAEEKVEDTPINVVGE